MRLDFDSLFSQAVLHYPVNIHFYLPVSKRADQCNIMDSTFSLEFAQPAVLKVQRLPCSNFSCKIFPIFVTKSKQALML